MTTAPVTVDDLLDFEITDPGTIKTRARRPATPAPVCRRCQPTKVAKARKSGTDLYSDCFVCASESA